MKIINVYEKIRISENIKLTSLFSPLDAVEYLYGYSNEIFYA